MHISNALCFLCSIEKEIVHLSLEKAFHIHLAEYIVLLNSVIY